MKNSKKWYDYLWIVSLTISVVSGTKGYCNKYCGRCQLFSILGGRVGLSNALEYILGVRRIKRFKSDCDFTLDFQSSLAVGLSWNNPKPRSCTICIWLLQRNAYFNDPWNSNNDLIQTKKLVRILSYGNNDTSDL